MSKLTIRYLIRCDSYVQCQTRKLVRSNRFSTFRSMTVRQSVRTSVCIALFVDLSRLKLTYRSQTIYALFNYFYFLLL